VTWPPVIPPADRTDTTPQAGNHPGDHNQISQAFTDVVTKVDDIDARLPTRVQSGLTGVPYSSGTSAAATITFPITFTASPHVVVTVSGGGNVFLAGAGTVTTTNFVCTVFRRDGVAQGSGITVQVFWIAVEP
jgi:hypothetical protein